MKFARDNAKDILAMGFDKKKTFIYSDLKYLGGHFLLNAWEFSRVTDKYPALRHCKSRFGTSLTDRIVNPIQPSSRCIRLQ
jgi:hypothetical protein